MRNAYEVALEFMSNQASGDIKDDARKLADLICTDRDVLKNRITDMINDFSWVLPLHENTQLNEVSDDAACAVQNQICAAVVALS